MKLLLCTIILFLLAHQTRADVLIFEIWSNNNPLNTDRYVANGTGFWISRDGFAITANHVLSDESKKNKLVYAKSEENNYILPQELSRKAIEEEIGRRNIFVLKLLDCDRKKDICLLKATSHRPNILAPKIGGDIAVDGRLKLRGLRYKNDRKYFPNEFYSSVRDVGHPEVVYISDIIPQGYSGGPVLADDKVVGISLNRDDTLQSGTILRISEIGQLAVNADLSFQDSSYWSQSARLSALEREVERLSKETDQYKAAIRRLQSELWIYAELQYRPIVNFNDDSGQLQRDLIIKWRERFPGQFYPSKIRVTVTPLVTSINEDHPLANMLPHTILGVRYSRLFEEREITPTLVIEDIMDELHDNLQEKLESIREASSTSMNEEPSIEMASSLKVEFKVWFNELAAAPRTYVQEIHRLPM